MRVSIDHAACKGHGRCYDHAPALFTDDDRGYGQVLGDGAVPESEHEAARRAVLACPERAVTIEER